MTHGAGSLDDVAGWALRYNDAASEWRGLIAGEDAGVAALVDRWRDTFEEAQREERRLVAAGQWVGGPPTLLAAIGQEYREAAMTAALGWLLRPDGQHGLGRAVIDGLGAVVGVDVAGTVRVVLEEVRHDTRADLVVYGSGWTLIVEAKTFSSERPRQLDRIHELWGREAGPKFVFLTRGERQPVTARESADHWHNHTWRQVAAFIRAALVKKDAATIAPGLHDYLMTLEIFHDA
ncbi:PD-(D/E)XK nuclease family protein [Micromonospora sp. NPDC085948]|uniref:PD-(D/E)XK nuclease family protein n=1 Tax=Micromonospora sp. NPDC085948 TaxID=3155293 RepID=UPI003422FD29